jgi:hypothetical protein
VLTLLGIKQVRELPMVNTAGREESFSAYYPPDVQPHAARVFGPFMGKWGYRFPAGWGVHNVPISRRLAFTAMDTTLNLVAARVPLSPQSPVVQRLKSAMRRLRMA